MPNRLLREGILDSDPVNSLSWPEEVFYRRLMSAVDDFGRFDARTAVLKSRLYPLKTDQVREADITRWIAACVKAGLIALYSTDGRPYLLFKKFKQHVRAETSKYPPPPDGDAVQMHRRGSADAPHVRSESESESESKSKSETQTQPVGERWKRFWDVYPKKNKRDEAFALFRSLDPPDDLVSEMVGAVRKKLRTADWQREEGRFIPLAANWLKDRAWEEFSAKTSKPRAMAEPEQTAEQKAEARRLLAEAAAKFKA